MTGPLALYRQRVERGELAADPAQAQAIAALDRLHRDLVRAGPPRRGWRQRLAALTGRASPPRVRGLYLWGSVGRGKTFMMDLFFGALPFKDKTRQHFHRFMASVHERLKHHRDVENPLELVADEIAAEARIICFDEFVVTDIADAMILGNLFAGLFARGVTLAATSNIAPEHLYKDGLQRQRFLPTIALLREHTEVLHVGGATDYRLRALERADTYQTPSGPAADQKLTEFFDAIAPDEGDHGGTIELFGRRIDYRRAADGVIWFDFAQICDGPRSQDDYIELSRLYQTVLVSNVPRFDVTLENQARRFIALVDEFYDRRVKLILSAAAPVTDLYAGEKLRFDIGRTQSRLQEMQTHDYLAEAHRP
ncbi:MAG TPA: cell division protein ZapE [Gammaproteobacteria bacterium]|jgi:cell division protein ZapE|nr:cell division protein ZapE [Gammaproteobacteria bacterium]